jgi:hypothetical protein
VNGDIMDDIYDSRWTQRDAARLREILKNGNLSSGDRLFDVSSSRRTTGTVG